MSAPVTIAQMWGELTINEQDGLLPGWVAVRAYPLDTITVREFYMSPWQALRHAREIARKTGKKVRVHVIRQGQHPRSYLIGK